MSPGVLFVMQLKDNLHSTTPGSPFDAEATWRISTFITQIITSVHVHSRGITVVAGHSILALDDKI